MIRKLKSGGYRLYSRKLDRGLAGGAILVPSRPAQPPRSMSGPCNISGATDAHHGNAIAAGSRRKAGSPAPLLSTSVLRAPQLAPSRSPVSTPRNSAPRWGRLWFWRNDTQDLFALGIDEDHLTFDPCNFKSVGLRN
jgi:hypothetical protein